jgi:hypothetical protein
MNSTSYVSYMNSLLNESSSSTVDLVSRLFASTLVGYQAQGGNPTFSNTFVGYQAGLGSLSTNSIGIGVSVAANSGSNSGNVIVGNMAAVYSVSASRNVILGTAAATALSGDENTFVGYSNSPAAVASQCISIGAYSAVNGSHHIVIGASNASYGTSNSITLGAYNTESNNSDNISIGNHIQNSGNQSLILNTRRSIVNPLINTSNDIINIQDRILGFTCNNAYAMSIVADALVVQTSSGIVDLLNINNGWTNDVHHIIGSCSPIEEVYAGIETTFPETVHAAKDFIVEGELLVMGGICYGGLVTPNHIFEGNVTLSNDLLVVGNATFCNDVNLVSSNTVVDNCNLSYYIEKISQVGTFFDSNVTCGDSNEVYADLGITFEDSVHTLSNMVVEGQLHVKGGICFGGLHAVQEPLLRTVHIDFSDFPYAFVANPFLETIDVSLTFDVETAGSVCTIELLLFGQLCASLAWTPATTHAAIYEANIMKVSQSEAHVASRMIPSGQNAVLTNTNVSNLNWNTSQEVRVRLSVSTDATHITGRSFKVLVSS